MFSTNWLYLVTLCCSWQALSDGVPLPPKNIHCARSQSCSLLFVTA